MAKPRQPDVCLVCTSGMLSNAKSQAIGRALGRSLKMRAFPRRFPELRAAQLRYAALA